MTNNSNQTEMEADAEVLPKSKAKFQLICASKCKRFALDYAKPPNKFHKFTQVSEDFLISCEAVLKEHIKRRVISQPSKGKTIK
jgi:hypothetical protein